MSLHSLSFRQPQVLLAGAVHTPVLHESGVQATPSRSHDVPSFTAVDTQPALASQLSLLHWIPPSQTTVAP